MRVLVWDTGYFMDYALLLASRGNTVDYYVDWAYPHPDLIDWAPGYGFAGLNKLKDVDSSLAEYDLIVFPDVGFGGLADMLRREGYAVVGASEEGERLELDREYMHETMLSFGVSRPETRIVRGVDAVADAVDELGGGYVKISTWRGNFETFYAENGDAARTIIEESGLGPLRHVLSFVVEEQVEGVEIGCDCLFNGSEFLRPYQYGIEVKDKLNASVFTDYSPWDETLSLLEPYLASTGYRGFISLEGILTSDGDVKLLDVTARLPFPAAGLHAAMRNLEDTLRAVAHGEYVAPEYASRAGVEIVVATELADKWLPVELSRLDGVMLKYAVKVRGRIYHVPAPVVAGAVGFGGDTREAYLKAVEVADAIGCPKCFHGGDAWGDYARNRELVEAYAP